VSFVGLDADQVDLEANCSAAAPVLFIQQPQPQPSSAMVTSPEQARLPSARQPT
jgi:hypothetical protein